MRINHIVTGLAAGWVMLSAVGAADARPLPSTGADFFHKGTQPRQTEPPGPTMIQDFLVLGSTCELCHRSGESGTTTLKPSRWRGSMHAHSFRDPIFQAAFVVAQQDAPGAGELCIRCHSPRAWIEGRGTPPTGNPDGSTLFYSDVDEGVTCIVCHRMVDPQYAPGVSPSVDQDILAVLSNAGFLPTQFGNAQMVLDPMDVRRGPFQTPTAGHFWLQSAFHREGNLCGTCHDVSSPHLSRVGGPLPAPTDTYVPNAFGAAHPTQNKYDMFPEQRTYSEWQNSEYATSPNGVFVPDASNPNLNRFGGNRTRVSQCQDCHVPAVTGQGCGGGPVRTDLPYHSFQAANIFAIDLLLHLYGPTGTDEFDTFTVQALNKQKTDSTSMLTKATDATLSQAAGELNVRLTNHCGHKLLTGMPEGRRIWINVRFFNGPTLLAERGFYDASAALLTTSDTKVYEAKFGLDQTMASLTGRPVGDSFNLMLVNTITKDNRIPPRGFTNAAFAASQAQPVAYAYADGQYWDDTRYCVPEGATRAQVRVYYQTSSREYIEFLRSENTTDSRGQTLYDAWLAVGKGAPVLMDDVSINLAPFALGDVNADGVTSFGDLTAVLSGWGLPSPTLAAGDANCDGRVDFSDITFILTYWGDVP